MAAYVASPAVRAAAHVIEDQWLGTQLAENASPLAENASPLGSFETFESLYLPHPVVAGKPS